MNIFVTNEDPILSARDLCDRHVPKMLLESAQMLNNAHHLLGNPNNATYRKLMVNHPCSIWTVKSKGNFEWLLEHAKTIAAEYTKRFGKIHLSEQCVYKCQSLIHTLRFPQVQKTDHVQVMPLIYRNSNTVTAYRSYIKAGKSFAKWDKGTCKPDWYDDHKVEHSLDGLANYAERGIPIEDGYLSAD